MPLSRQQPKALNATGRGLDSHLRTPAHVPLVSGLAIVLMANEVPILLMKPNDLHA